MTKNVKTTFTIVILLICGCGKKLNPHTTWCYGYSDKRIKCENNSTENLCNYNCYYRIIYRHEDSIERIYKGSLDSSLNNSKIHITDLQYLFVNNDKTKFILISSVPIRNIGKKRGYHLDKNHSTYKNQININIVKQIIFGNIIDSKMTANYENFTENFKISYTEKSIDSTIKFTHLYYPNKKRSEDRNIILNSVFSEDLFTFKKIKNNFSLCYTYKDKITRTLKKQISFCRFKDKNKPKNLIGFEISDTNSINKDDYKIDPYKFYFKEQGDRFDFLYP